MFDYFNVTDTTDYEYMLAAMGSDVLVNETDTIRALITNTNLEQYYDDKRISSLSELNRGDLIQYNDENFMVVSEQSTKRYNKWKGIIRRCNFDISIYTHDEEVDTGLVDDMGRPVYETVPQYEDYPAIITTKVMEWSTGGAINLPEGEIEVTIQDKQSEYIVEEKTFEIMGKPWEINYIDRSQVGLLLMKVIRTVTTN